MENKEIKLNIQLTEKDYLNFQTDHVGLLRSKSWWVYGTFVLIYVIINFIANDFSRLSFTSLIPVFVFGLAISFSIFSVRSKVKTAFASDPAINHPMELIITYEGIIINSYRANNNPLWEDIYRYNITKNAIYIYTAENKSILIPKRVFESENDLNLLIELLKNKIDLSTYEKQKGKNKYKTWIVPLVIFAVILTYLLLNNPGDSAKLKKARVFEDNSDYKSALVIYSELINDDSENDRYYPYRANCEIALEDYKSAILDCEKAININPKSGVAYYNYAFALYYDKQYSKACKAIHKSMETGYVLEDDGLCDPPIKDTIN